MVEAMLEILELDAVDALSVQEPLKLLDALFPNSHVISQPTVEAVDQVLLGLSILLEFDADEAFVKKQLLLEDVH